MGTKKKILREWLEELLDEGFIENLQWLDKAKGLFQFKWVHVCNSQWDNEDGAVYKAWAVHKGHHFPDAYGQWPADDYPKWKSLFRCAISKSKDVLEVTKETKENGVLKTYQLYRRGAAPLPAMVSPPEQRRDDVPERKIIQRRPEPPPIPLTVISESEPLLNSPVEMYHVSDIPKYPVERQQKFDPRFPDVRLPNSLSVMSFHHPPKARDLCVWIKYRNMLVASKYVTHDHGCRIFYPGNERVQTATKHGDGQVIVFPHPGADIIQDEHQRRNTEALLKNLTGGLYLSCDDDGKVYATRRTNCKIYYANPQLTARVPSALTRQQTTQVFDGNSLVTEALMQTKDDECLADEPNVSVLFSFGETWSLNTPFEKCHISMTVAHAATLFQVKKILMERKDDPRSHDFSFINEIIREYGVQDKSEPAVHGGVSASEFDTERQDRGLGYRESNTRPQSGVFTHEFGQKTREEGVIKSLEKMSIEDTKETVKCDKLLTEGMYFHPHPGLDDLINPFNNLVPFSSATDGALGNSTNGQMLGDPNPFGAVTLFDDSHCEKENLTLFGDTRSAQSLINDDQPMSIDPGSLEKYLNLG